MEVISNEASALLEWTGERYLPWLEEAAIGYEHLHRYAYATQLVQNKRVLDLACGEGYGSYLLAKTAESVVGIDIDERAIKHARNKYIKQNLEFKVGSITEVPTAGEHLFEVAVCFEALEHIEDHHKLLSEVKRLLTPDGVFIVSTPNKTVYTDESQYNNPFHVHELYFDEFRELFEKHFKNVRFLGQRIYCNSNIWPVFAGEDTKAVEYVIDRNPKEFVFVENDKRIPLYFIAVASDADREIEETGSALIDVSDALLKQTDGQIKAYVTEQERLAGEISQLSATVRAQKQALARRDEQSSQLEGERERLAADVTQLQAALESRQQELAESGQHANHLARDITELQSVLSSQKQTIEEKRCQLDQLSLDEECLRRDVLTLQVTVRDQREELSNKDLQIIDLITRRDHSNDQLESMRIRFQEKDRELAELRSDQESLRRDVSILEVALQHQRIAQETVCGSLGWLLTKRFRPVKDKLLLPGSRFRQVYDNMLAALKDRLRSGSLSLPNEIHPLQFVPLWRKELENKSVSVQSTRQNGTIGGRTALEELKPVLTLGGRDFAIYTSSVGN